jgi:NTE family protein
MKLLRKKKKSRLGLALGGGAVLGAAHIGVIRALEEKGLSPKYIAGTSVGSLVGALYAFGKSWRDILEFTENLNWFDVSGVTLSRLGLLSNKKLSKLLHEAIGDVDFADAPVPLAVIATDISTGEKVVLREGSVCSAVMASSCIPGVFEPVEVDGRLLVDGGIVENVPVRTLLDLGAEYTIGVDLLARHSSKKPENIVELLIQSLNFSLMALAKLQTEETDLLLTPDLGRFNLVSTGHFEDLVEAGYREAMRKLE